MRQLLKVRTSAPKRAGFEPALFCLKIGLFRYALLFVGACRIHDCTRFISIDRSLLHKLQTLCNGETVNAILFQDI